MKQNEKIKFLKDQVVEEESDKSFLFSKAKEQLKLASEYRKVIKKQILENKILNAKNAELLEAIKELKL